MRGANPLARNSTGCFENSTVRAVGVLHSATRPFEGIFRMIGGDASLTFHMITLRRPSQQLPKGQPMVLPLGDDDTARRTVPIVTYALIALNVLVFLLE